MRSAVVILFFAGAFSTVALAADAPVATRLPAGLAPDLTQPIDAEATARIRKYTTAPDFNSPLTDYLPASATVPAPQVVLGDVAGAPGILPYSADVHRYFRLLAAATQRVQIFTIGTSEEGRERIVVAISSEENLAQAEENRARLGQLADPRTIGFDDARATAIVAASVPVYYITGAIHSPETGSPTALMELAYRLAVDESPYVQKIRANLITLITPVVEVDGRDRMVDVYRWHLAHPGSVWPRLSYWGHYVAHDNNRDAMGLTLSLSRNVLDTHLAWHGQVLHDLHESVPFLYDNTVGDGPYNAWVDPLLTNEWQQFGWTNVAEMTKLGMPGVFTHGEFDTWSPGYLMFMAAMHNSVSRLYETFGNGGADTETRELSPDQYSRTWYRQDPPWPRVEWSQRNNNNYQQTGLLVSLAFAAENRMQLLTNFYTKSRRSIEKPQREGPSAWVLPADDRRPEAQAELLRVLGRQHVEIHRLTAPFSLAEAAEKATGAETAPATSATGSGTATAPRLLPSGSYVVRMDQPFSRIADALLDRQYWSPDDPQQHPYDDTGWSFGELFDVEALRVTENRILDAAMTRVDAPVFAPAGVSGTGTVFLVAHRGADAMLPLRYALAPQAGALESVRVEAATVPFRALAREFARGSWIVTGIDRERLDAIAKRLGVAVVAATVQPQVATRAVPAPRIALLHSWLSTQTEGWWRQRLDLLGVPYAYISTQDVAATPALGALYDVILFPPVGMGDPQRIVTGLPMWGEPLPWKATAETPNLGTPDATDDQRPGLGFAGLEHLRQFVEQGGLLVAVDDTASLLIANGLTPGVRVAEAGSLKVVGSILDARFPTETTEGATASPVTEGFATRLSVYSAEGMSFELSRLAAGGFASEEEPGRPTGRGGKDETDTPQGRAFPAAASAPAVERWESPPLTSEQLRRNPNVIPQALLPRALLRFGDSKTLLVSGLLDHGSELAERAAVVDAPLGKGHILLFAINPVWRGSTIGSHPLVWNAILGFDRLSP
jgi:hypothetical protein